MKKFNEYLKEAIENKLNEASSPKLAKLSLENWNGEDSFESANFDKVDQDCSWEFELRASAKKYKAYQVWEDDDRGTLYASGSTLKACIEDILDTWNNENDEYINASWEYSAEYDVVVIHAEDAE